MELLVYSLTLQFLQLTFTGGHYLKLLPNDSLTTSLYTAPEYRSFSSAEPKVRSNYTQVGNFENKCQEDNTFAFCSGLNLTSVPEYLNPNITYLDISRNKIKNLANTLSKYTNLEYLNISKNHLHALSIENFSNLRKLIHLNLKENYLSMDSAFPPLVFQDLSSLQTLMINYNNKNLSRPDLKYPDKVLSVLHKLTDLYMDGLLNTSLGPGFRNLTSLICLTLSGPRNGDCTTVFVTNDTFLNVKNLQLLNLTGCCLDGRRMDTGVFLPLKRLHSLDISRNEQGCLEDLYPVLQSLQQLNVTYLAMTGVINPYTPGVTVSRTFLTVLPRSLRTLVARSNSFEIIDGDNMDYLPKTLTILDISDNRFTFGAYLKNFTKLENLRELHLNGGTITFDLPTDYPDTSRKCINSNIITSKSVIGSVEFTPRSTIDSTEFFSKSVIVSDESTSRVIINPSEPNSRVIINPSEPTSRVIINPGEATSKHTQTMQNIRDQAFFTLPRNLKSVSIEFAGWSYSLTKFTIDPNNSLTKLSLNGNNLYNLQGPITGLTNLKELDLVQCNIYSISEHFFNDFPSLEKLNMSSNFFGTYSLSSGQNSRFKNLTKLKQLDLSFVNILVITSLAFEGLVSLEKLWLHNNAFYYFDVQISHMKNLEFIDFRFTELTKLNASTMNDLITIYKINKRLSVDFTETPIHCYCENLFFIEWVITYDIFPKNLTRYKCVFLDTSERYMTSFDGIYHKLQRQCKPETTLFVVILIGILLVLCIIVLSIGYRYRWKLRYLYYSAYINFNLKKDQTGTLDEFMYDVFLSYVSDDQTFVMKTLASELKSRGLKLHIHAFDFVAGEFIASNIVNAIQSSRHTLVVLTRRLLDSAWCKYELQMANMEGVHTGRPVLVFLLMENLTKKEMGTELLYHIQNNTYVRYPEVDHHQNPQIMEVFWRKLVADLQA